VVIRVPDHQHLVHEAVNADAAIIDEASGLPTDLLRDRQGDIISVIVH